MLRPFLRGRAPLQSVLRSVSRCLATLLRPPAALRPSRPPPAALRAFSDVGTSIPASSKVLFETVWNRFEKAVGIDSLYFPREIIWLAGAPGAGKGTMSKYIMRAKGITVPPIETSSLFQTPELVRKKEQGLLINDEDVLFAVVKEIFKPRYLKGVIVDGFPRTLVQAECIKHLYQKVRELRNRHEARPTVMRNINRPNFHIAVLYVDEVESIRRQLIRGQIAEKHNRTVKETGIGRLQALRGTDVDSELAKLRYKTFRDEVYEALQVVKDAFHFHLIDASGTPEEVLKKIEAEFEYQSSLELSDHTYEKVKVIPLAHHVLRGSRNALINRLNSYSSSHLDQLRLILRLMKDEFLPALETQSLTGHCIVQSRHFLLDQSLSIDMVLDVLTERGYYASCDVVKSFFPRSIQQVPSDPNPQEQLIQYQIDKLFTFDIRFDLPSIRRGF